MIRMHLVAGIYDTKNPLYFAEYRGFFSSPPFEASCLNLIIIHKTWEVCRNLRNNN